MTRKEGIIKQWKGDKTAMPLTSEQEQKLLTSEYCNYIELCAFCMEKPLTREQWLNQEIKAAHK